MNDPAQQFAGDRPAFCAELQGVLMLQRWNLVLLDGSEPAFSKGAFEMMAQAGADLDLGTSTSLTSIPENATVRMRATPSAEGLSIAIV